MIKFMRMGRCGTRGTQGELNVHKLKNFLTGKLEGEETTW
jgi:hypothetical protein